MPTRHSMERIKMTTELNPIAEPLKVICLITAETPGHTSLYYQIKNVSTALVHVFDSPRMPYIFIQEDGSLLVLHGVHPPDPDLDYYGIEIPITRPLPPGEVMECKVSLTPLYLKNHYEEEREPADLHGQVIVHCNVGWGERPILISERHTLSIEMLLAWQHIAHAEAVRVYLP
jgi:hypothetical protein